MKAATNPSVQCIRTGTISIHAAREGGDRIRFILRQSGLPISIHAAREGGDDRLGKRTNKTAISIHAAREGGDVLARGSLWLRFYFNPRRP